MNYSSIIDDFEWSYSRITAFEMCPYGFLLRYIKRTKKQRQFFSDYGTFLHKLIQQYLDGELTKEELPTLYLLGFQQEVKGVSPSGQIFQKYFDQGYNYLTNLDFPYKKRLWVERQVDFEAGGYPFTGILDCLSQTDDGLVIIDNKSKGLKSRSKRTKPTKTDEELDASLRQLYLYCTPVKDAFGVFPVRLEFNCYRVGEWISEPFNKQAYDEAQEWAKTSIEKITNNEDWSPNIDFWKCRYICSFSDRCEYFQMNKE